MSNPLKKTMVYLGLADEEFEQEAPQAPAPAAIASAKSAVIPAEIHSASGTTLRTV